MERLFENLSTEERVQKMNELCHHKEIQEFDKPLSPEEIQAVKDIVTDRAGKMQALNDEKKKFMDAHNAEMKPLKEEFDIKVKEARNGTRLEEGEVWFIDNQEAGTMSLVDESGTVIMTRPLRREERDTSVFNMAANG